MPPKTNIDFVNDPVQLAVKILEDRKQSVLSMLRTGRKVSPMKQAMPDGMSMKRMADIFSSLERDGDGGAI